MYHVKYILSFALYVCVAMLFVSLLVIKYKSGVRLLKGVEESGASGLLPFTEIIAAFVLSLLSWVPWTIVLKIFNCDIKFNFFDSFLIMGALIFLAHIPMLIYHVKSRKRQMP